MTIESEAVFIVFTLVSGLAVYWYFFKKKQEEKPTSKKLNVAPLTRSLSYDPSFSTEMRNDETVEAEAEDGRNSRYQEENMIDNKDMSEHRECDLCLGVSRRKGAEAYCEKCEQFHCSNCKIQHQSLTSRIHSSLSVDEGIMLVKSKATMNCDLCKLIGEVSIASKWCFKCNNKPLCVECARKHNVDNATRFHSLTEDFTSRFSNESERHDRINRDDGTNVNGNALIIQKKETEKDLICKSIELETENFVRFVLLLMNCGTRILRKILIWGLERTNTTLIEFLSSNKKAICSHREVQVHRKDILYPRPPKQADINQWDISLLCFITVEYFSHKLSSTEKVAVEKIRKMRNKFCAHQADHRIDDQTFMKLWSKLILVIQTIGHHMEEAERAENNTWMDKLASAKLDMNKATEKIKNLDTPGLRNIQISLNDIIGKVSIIVQDFTVLKKDLSDIRSVIESTGNVGKTEHSLYAVLDVRAETQSDQAETALLAACKKDTRSGESQEEKTLKQTMKNLYDEIEKTGAEVQDVDQGSIIFTFKCKSIACILDLLDVFESAELQRNVSEIAEALKDVIGHKVQLTAYLLRQPLLEVLRTLRGTDVQFSNAPTGLEGLNHVLKSFEEDGLSKHELSLALSHCVGRRVTLETEVDIDKLQHTIYITKEELASSGNSQGVSTENMDTVKLSAFEPGETTAEEMTNQAATPEAYPIFKGPFTSGERQELHDDAATGHRETYSATNVERDQTEDRDRLFRKDCPGQPRASTVSADTVTLVWDPPSKFERENYYQIYYSTDTSSNYNWEVYPIEAKYETAKLTGLKTKTTYVFRVRAMYNDGEGPYSPNSLEITTSESLASRFLPEATKIHEGKSSPSTYRLPVREIKSARDETNKTKKYEVCAAQKGYVKSKTILLIGATGTGKTTLVDGIVNYALGVGWKDSFRYTTVHPEESEEARLKNQALSQTDWVTCYTINLEKGSRLKYQLQVIDTPGFGDTQGPSRDNKIKTQLQGLFCQEEPKGVNYIDAICFLVKSPDARLTVSQKYVFESVMSLFGKDVEKNICYLITFSDDTDPPVLAAMKECNLPVGRSFKFNNSALFPRDENADVGDMGPIFWNMGLDSFSEFFEHLNYVETRSLQQTKAVLDEIHLFETAVSNLQPQLDLGMSKLVELKEEKSILNKLFLLNKDAMNFEYKTVEIKPQKRIFPAGKQAAKCRNCYHICYEVYTNTDNKTQRCSICPNKCPWMDHTYVESIYEYIPVKVNKQYLNMRKKIEKVKGHPPSQEQVVEELELELTQLVNKVELLMFAVKTCTDRLSEIALRRPNPLSITDYIDLMIENENKKQLPGFENRMILGLMEIRKRTEITKEYKQFSEEASKELGENKSAWFRSVFENANNLTTEITAIE